MERARHWIIELDAGELSPEDSARFTQWLNERAEHRQAFEALQGRWRSLDALQDLRTARPDPGVVAQWLRRRRFRRRLLPLAAAATVAAIAAGLWFTQPPPVHEAYHATRLGEQHSVVLPDDSVLTLNTRSRVRVRYSGDLRKIELLRGEAHFDVASDVDRPFIVVAGGGTLRAVGTAFAVHLKQDAVEVTVTEGTVELLATVSPVPERRSAQAPAQPVAPVRTLTERDKIRYKADTVEAVATVTEHEIERALAWRDGMLDFQDTPLADVIAEAGRYTREDWVIVDPELESVEFTGYFRAADAELLMGLLESNDFISAHRVDAGTVNITKAGSLPN